MGGAESLKDAQQPTYGRHVVALSRSPGLAAHSFPPRTLASAMSYGPETSVSRTDFHMLVRALPDIYRRLKPEPLV